MTPPATSCKDSQFFFPQPACSAMPIKALSATALPCLAPLCCFCPLSFPALTAPTTLLVKAVMLQKPVDLSMPALIEQFLHSHHNPMLLYSSPLCLGIFSV